MRNLLPLATLLSIGLLSPAASAHGGHGSSRDTHVSQARGDLDLHNGAGTTLRVTLDGASVMDLYPGQDRALNLPAGWHHVTVTYRQLGRDRVLSSEDVNVYPGRVAVVRFAPVTEGLVRVDNSTGRDATVLVDGRPAARLPAGASAEVVTSLGRVSIALVDQSRTLDATSISVGAYQDLTWRAEAPRVGDLVVTNPNPVPVVVRDGLGRSVTIAGRAQVRLSGEPVGLVNLEVRRQSGELIGRGKAQVLPYEVSAWSAPVPNDGLVSVRNDNRRPVTVWVDGARVSTLAPHEQVSLELSLGWRRVQIRDISGYLILDTRVNVDPYATRSLNSAAGGAVAYEDRSDDRRYDDDRHHDDWDDDREDCDGHQRPD